MARCLIVLYNVEAEHFQTFELAVFSKGGSLIVLQLIGLLDLTLASTCQGGRMQWVVGPSFKFGGEKDTQPLPKATSEHHEIFSWEPKVPPQSYPPPINKALLREYENPLVSLNKAGY